MKDVYWDYIIVGAGSAGCVLANRLSMDPNVRVLLLEAGGWDLSPVFSVPAGEERAIANPRYAWPYATTADPTRENRTESWPAGRVLGGSSSINGMIYLRGNRGDYDRWAQMGAVGWDYDGVLPFFRRAEHNSRGSDEWRAQGGPLSVADVRTPHKLVENFVNAAQELGLPYNEDVNGASQFGVGRLQATQLRGWRHSAARAYLWPILMRRNLKIKTSTYVERIIIKNKCAIGVKILGADGPELKGRRVILSAGALATPRLLMLSGIGPGNHLRDVGISIVHDLAAVGHNLQEHPGVMLSAEVSVRTYNVETDIWSILKHGANWLVRGRGPGATPIGHAVAFAKTGVDADDPDVQLTFTPIGYNTVGDGPLLHSQPAVVVAVNVCRPQSRGTISLRSADAHELPLIKYHMFEARSDLDTLRRGARLGQRILHSKAFSAVKRDDLKPGTDVKTDEQWDTFLRKEAMRFSHPAGTCRMGSDERSVVDPKLRVMGIRGLYIADASIMPSLPSANTNAAAIMIGEKAADLISGTAS